MRTPTAWPRTPYSRETPARVVYQEVRAHLDSFAAVKNAVVHHAGHGLGLEAWEPP